jgi:hypothetical protein
VAPANARRVRPRFALPFGNDVPLCDFLGYLPAELRRVFGRAGSRRSQLTCAAPSAADEHSGAHQQSPWGRWSAPFASHRLTPPGQSWRMRVHARCRLIPRCRPAAWRRLRHTVLSGRLSIAPGTTQLGPGLPGCRHACASAELDCWRRPKTDPSWSIPNHADIL